jgi:ADP-ribose pyrophosphatase
MAYLVRNSETIYKGKVFGVRIDEVETHTGHIMRVDIVEHSGAVVLIPIDDNGLIWFVRQYRHPTGRIMLELPAGTLDPDEEPEACAVRECREEIGMTPGRLLSLGWVYLAPGYSTEVAHFFLAERLTPAQLKPDEHEDLQIECLSWDSILKMISEKELHDAKSLAGLFLTRAHLGKLASLSEVE